MEERKSTHFAAILIAEKESLIFVLKNCRKSYLKVMF